MLGVEVRGLYSHRATHVPPQLRYLNILRLRYGGILVGMARLTETNSPPSHVRGPALPTRAYWLREYVFEVLHIDLPNQHLGNFRMTHSGRGVFDHAHRSSTDAIAPTITPHFLDFHYLRPSRHPRDAAPHCHRHFHAHQPGLSVRLRGAHNRG